MFGVCVCVRGFRRVHTGFGRHGAGEAGGQHGEDGRCDRGDPHVHHHPPRSHPHLQAQVRRRADLRVLPFGTDRNGWWSLSKHTFIVNFLALSTDNDPVK